MTQVPLPRTLPPAQKVLEYTSIVRSEVQDVSKICTRITGSSLTLVRLNVILGGPCGMSAVHAVDGDRVVFSLVNDIDLLVITQEHLKVVMSILSGIKSLETPHLLRTDTRVANALKSQQCRSL